MPRFTRPRVVDLRRSLCICTVAGSFIQSVVIIYTEVLCILSNDRTASEALALTRSTPTRLWMLQYIHQMFMS